MSYPTKNEHVFSTAVDDQLLLHDTATQQTHCLNPLARRVWELCDGTHDRQAMAQTLASEGTRDAGAVVDAALDRFAEQGLLAGPATLNRRTAGTRVAQAIAAGLVISIVAPGRAAHASTVSCDSLDETACNNEPTCTWIGICIANG